MPAFTDDLRVYISVFSLAFAIWQYIQNRKIKRLIAFEAIELHQNIAIALGATQAAKATLGTSISPAAEIGRAEGLTQAVLFESAKLFCNLRNTTIDDINDLISNRQLEDKFRHIYLAFSNRKRGIIRSSLKCLRKVY